MGRRDDRAPSLRPSPRYQAFYCEENVWHLCAHPALRPYRREVALISNAASQVWLLAQRAAPDALSPVVWDYHVILLARDDGDPGFPWRVWDLDSRLAAGTPAATYVARTFALAPVVGPRLAPRFRILPADDYVRLLCSDRSHMLTADGDYTHPPPPWPPIGPPDRPSNLMRLTQIDDSPPGTCVDLDGFRARFTSSSAAGGARDDSSR